MTSYRKQRAARKRLIFSAMGKASQRAQSERRMADMPERLREMVIVHLRGFLAGRK